MSEEKMPDDHPGHTLPASALHGSDVGGPTVCAAIAAKKTGRTTGFGGSALDSTGEKDEL